MNSEDEEKKQQEDQELDLFKKFYDFACQCKQQAKEKFEFNYCEDNNKIQFSYDKNNDNLIPTDNMNDIDLTSKPIFCCIGGLFVMLSQGKDGNTNVYALNDNCINKIDNNFNDINANIQDIKQCVFKIKDVPIENAKKFLSSFVNIQEPSDENNFAKQVKNELDFKYVFSEIVNNDNANNIAEIVNNNHKQLDVIKLFRTSKLENISKASFQGFNNESVQLNEYDDRTDDISNGQKVANLTDSAFYFGKQGLLMAITKSNNNGKVNVFATNTNMPCDNPSGGNDEYTGLFAVYDASKEDAEGFIKKLNTHLFFKENYENINSQEKFEQFFQDHCKQNIKIEKDDGKSNVCCWGLFNCCGASKAK